MANRVKEDEKNERIIRNLLKLPENRRCINCNSLGPQYVCTNFSTFVCTTCSGIHREFTHRVKSVSMAKFTPQEVSALQGGGNASAREIYLKEWDPQRNSLPDASNIERLRDFIKHIYVDRRYTGERSLEKPLRAKMGETEDFNGNRRADTYQGGSRSPPYEETSERRHDRPSLGGRSPGYDQDNRQQNDYKRSPVRAEIINDWRREDRFGNGRRSEDRNSDGGSKLEGRSPDSQRDSDVSSPPMVRPVRDILGENVSPLRVIEPPKATGGKSTDGSTHTQRNASSSSLASSDGNLPAIKVEASFIDFDSVPEPAVAATVPQTQAATNSSEVQLMASSGNDWANFDSVPQVKVHTPVSNSVESVLSELSIAVSSSGPSAPVDKLSPFHSSGSEGSAFGSIFESIAPPSAFPLGSAPAASPPAPQLSTVEGTMLANTRHSVFPGASGVPVPQPVTTIGGPSSNRPWSPLVDPSIHGPTGAAITQVGQPITNPALDTTFGLSTESSLHPKSGGRKELPADLFTMTNSYLPPPVSGWYSGSPYAAGFPTHYNVQMAIPNFQPVSRSTNPFEFSNERANVQSPMFPSVASLHGPLPRIVSAPGLLRPLPRIASSPGLIRTSSLGTPSSLPLSMLAQPQSHASAFPPSSLLGQELAGSVAPRPLGLSGFGFEEPAFMSLNPNHQVRGLHPAHSAPSNFTSTGGNPFG